jgi:hypothetical protein
MYFAKHRINKVAEVGLKTQEMTGASYDVHIHELLSHAAVFDTRQDPCTTDLIAPSATPLAIYIDMKQVGKGESQGGGRGEGGH